MTIINKANFPSKQLHNFRKYDFFSNENRSEENPRQ